MSITENDKIKEYWEERARWNVKSGEVTHFDVWQRWLEIELIKKFVTNSRVLDIGCGNGYTTKEIAPFAQQIIGMDYSKTMIERATDELVDLDKDIRSKIGFEVCDVLQLSPTNYGLFDIAISERCLINLKSWQDQKKAIKNVASVLKSNGKYLFMEGMQDGLDELNKLRRSLGLDCIEKAWYNVNFQRKQLLQFLSGYFEIEEEIHTGMYDLISRVVHPLMVAPQSPSYNSKFNEIAAKLALQSQEYKDISRVIFLVLKKRQGK